MSGFTLEPMPSEFNDCHKAEARAKEIYKLSEDCLMAHSIRAVEKHLLEKYDFNTQIVVAIEDWLRTDLGRVSGCSVPASSGDVTYIYVQNDLEFNMQRFCIAHELYHVLWSVGSTEPGDHSRSVDAEELCDCFANDLCLQHRKFYEKIENVDRLKSIGERRFRSVDRSSDLAGVQV